MEGVAEGLRIWSCGVLLSSGGQSLSSILQRSVVRLVRGCVVGLMGLVCVIVGSSVGIGRLVALNLVR